MEKNMKQTDRLLAYLQEHKDINPMQAWTILGIYRLGARIFDLKRAGHRITQQRQNVFNRFGERCSVALYRLEL